MVIELRVVQFWSEIILAISNHTRTARSFDFEITCMISDQIALHSVQLIPLVTSFSILVHVEMWVRTKNFLKVVKHKKRNKIECGALFSLIK